MVLHHLNQYDISDDYNLNTIYDPITSTVQIKDETVEKDIIHHIVATIACHSAIKSGSELTEEQLLLLIKQAESVDFYHNCPHGRRVFRT